MPSADFSRQTLFRPNPFSLGHRLLILKLLGISSARSLGVRHTSFTAQPFDLPSWRYVCLLGFGLLCNLTRHLALYQVSVRRLNRFATPLPSPRLHGLRLAVCYTWRQILVVGLSPTRCAPCPTHNKKKVEIIFDPLPYVFDPLCCSSLARMIIKPLFLFEPLRDFLNENANQKRCAYRSYANNFK